MQTFCISGRKNCMSARHFHWSAGPFTRILLFLLHCVSIGFPEGGFCISGRKTGPPFSPVDRTAYYFTMSFSLCISGCQSYTSAKASHVPERLHLGPPTLHVGSRFLHVGPPILHVRRTLASPRSFLHLGRPILHVGSRCCMSAKRIPPFTGGPRRPQVAVVCKRTVRCSFVCWLLLFWFLFHGHVPTFWLLL